MGRRSLDLAGKHFHRWVVLEQASGLPGWWLCCCKCGTVKTVLGSSLVYGNSKSCGCLQKELQRVRATEPTKRSHLLTYQGKTQSLARWSREYNLAADTIRNRLNRGWDLEKALSTPSRAARSPDLVTVFEVMP